MSPRPLLLGPVLLDVILDTRAAFAEVAPHFIDHLGAPLFSTMLDR